MEHYVTTLQGEVYITGVTQVRQEAQDAPLQRRRTKFIKINVAAFCVAALAAVYGLRSIDIGMMLAGVTVGFVILENTLEMLFPRLGRSR